MMKFNLYRIIPTLSVDRTFELVIPYDVKISDVRIGVHHHENAVLQKTFDLKELVDNYDVGQVLLSIEDHGYFGSVMANNKKDIKEAKEEIVTKLDEIKKLMDVWF